MDKVGRAGGLEIMWKQTVKCTVATSSNNHIDVVFQESSIPTWRLTCFYGLPERSRRQDSWDMLRQLAVIDSLPWCVFGDFNDLLYTTDKKGAHPHP